PLVPHASLERSPPFISTLPLHDALPIFDQVAYQPPLPLALDVAAGVCAQPPLGRVDGVGIPLLRLLLLQPRLGVVHRRGLTLDPAVDAGYVAHACLLIRSVPNPCNFRFRR